MSEMNGQKILEIIAKANIQHIQASPLEISFNGKKGTFIISRENALDYEFRFTEKGLGTIQWLCNGRKGLFTAETEYLSKYAHWTSLVRRYNKANKEDKARLAQNILRDLRMIFNIVTQEEEKLYFHFGNNRLVGITRKYNTDITNEDIVDALGKTGLISRVESVFVNDESVVYHIAIRDGETKTFLRIENGYSGHKTLQYRIRVSLISANRAKASKAPIEFISEPIAHNRHLKNLKTVFESLERTAEQIVNQGIAEWYGNANGEDFDAVYEQILALPKSELDKMVASDGRKKIHKLSDVSKNRADEMLRYIRSSDFSLAETLADYYEKQYNVYGYRGVIDSVLSGVFTQKFAELMV